MSEKFKLRSQWTSHILEHKLLRGIPSSCRNSARKGKSAAKILYIFKIQIYSHPPPFNVYIQIIPWEKWTHAAFWDLCIMEVVLSWEASQGELGIEFSTHY